jgi:TctA family transporter
MLYPSIMVLCCIGIYSLNNSVFDVGVAVLFGLLGYVFIKLKCEPAPLLLGFVLGPMLEENLRKAMTISRGDPSVFFTRPLSLSMLVVAAVLVLIMILPVVRRRRAEAFQEA